MNGETPGPGPEDLTTEQSRPADIIKYEGDSKVIPIDTKFPTSAEAYKDKEAISRGEVAKPIDEERFNELSEWILGKDRPQSVDEVGELRTNTRDFFGESTNARTLGYVNAFTGKTFGEVVTKFGARPEYLRENLFSEFVETLEQESKDTLLGGESDLGELSPEEILAVEVFYGFPRAILNEIRIEKELKISADLQNQYFEGLYPTDVSVEMEQLRELKKTNPEFSTEQEERLTSADQYTNSSKMILAMKRENGVWQQNLYKFILSNQNHPKLSGTMRSFFTAFEENMTAQENFSRFINGDTKSIMAILRSGSLAVVTAAKAIQQAGEREAGTMPTEIFLPEDIRTDADHGVDLMAGGRLNYLFLQVKHTRKLSGVEIDGDLSYNDPEYARAGRILYNNSEKFRAELGPGASIVPRMVLVGNVGAEDRFTGIPQSNIRLSGKTTNRQIWEEGGQVWKEAS